MKLQQHTHIGQRTNNEDYLATRDNIYVVCDGVGGHNKGEVASREVAKYIVDNYKNERSKQAIQQLIKAAQEHLNTVLAEQPEAMGMATTLCSVFHTNEAMFLAHIGDSRIYVVQPKHNRYWCTADHSLVGNLLQAKQITEQEARNHPRANEINRAIVANHNAETVQADITKFTNVEQGTLIFVCSDGVTESFTNNDLFGVLASQKTLEQKKKVIQDRCALQSKDNNTFLLLEIEESDAIIGSENQEIDWIEFFKDDTEQIEEKAYSIDEDNVLDTDQEFEANQDVDATSVLKKLIPFIVIAILLLLLAFYLMNR